MAKGEIKKLLDNYNKTLEQDYENFKKTIKDELQNFKKKTLEQI